VPISGYVRVEEIARGGMGHVDLVLRHEGSFRRLYAMKRLNPSLREDPELIAMFLDEARVAGLIRHPNVVSVLDVGEDESGPFLVMDFVEGLPLSDVVREHGAAGEHLPVQVCVDIVRQVAEGLHAAHELVSHEGEPLSVVHRDVSPHNVLLGHDGGVRLTDFGVAKALGRQSATTTDVLKGKVAYMSPEQLRFEPLDRRSDLFSVGVILYELLSLERLYHHPDVSRSARAVLDDPPPDIAEKRSDVPDALVMLLFDLLCKDRAHRPATARDVAERLEEIAVGLLDAESPLPLGVFVDERYGKLRAAETDRRNQAVRAAESATLTGEREDPAARAAKRPGRFALVLMASVLAALAIGLAFGLSMTDTTSAVASSDADPDGNADADTNSDTETETGTETSETETTETGTTETETETETGTETEAQTPGPRHRMRRPRMRPPTDTRDMRLWGWE
jgi:serine/threonine-protein kinase